MPFFKVFRIAFEINNQDVAILPEDRYPTKNEIKNLIKYCNNYLTIDDSEIEKANIELEKSIMEMWSREKIYPKKIKKKEGYIYFLQEKQGRVKIGKTKLLNNRITKLGITLPDKPILLHTIQTNDIDKPENFFHNKYKQLRVNGEWFQLSQKDIRWIKLLSEVTEC